VLYVEELIGKNTVNTVPPATLDAFRDHGKLRDSLEENIEDAKAVLAGLEQSGISLDAITPTSSRTASSCLPTPPTSCTARWRTSAPRC
jgi:Transaldolase